MLRLMAVDLVEEAGFIALEAANADEAVALLEQRSDIGVVFTDVDMPGSMDGLKLANAIRDRWPPVEIIVTSGHVRLSDVDLPQRTVFFPKPYDSRQIVTQLREFASAGS